MYGHCTGLVFHSGFVIENRVKVLSPITIQGEWVVYLCRVFDD